MKIVKEEKHITIDLTITNMRNIFFCSLIFCSAISSSSQSWKSYSYNLPGSVLNFPLDGMENIQTSVILPNAGILTCTLVVEIRNLEG